MPRPRRSWRWRTASPAAAKFFISAPFMIVGLFPARCRIQPIMPTVVDFPLVPATPTPRVARVEEVGEKPRARGDGGADATRGLHVGDRFLDRGGGDQDLTGAAHAAAILRMQRDATRAQKIESFGVASLVERAVRTLDPIRPWPGRSERGGSCHYRRRRKRSNLRSRDIGGIYKRCRSSATRAGAAGMSREKCRIGVVAPGSRMTPEVAEKTQALAASLYPDRTIRDFLPSPVFRFARAFRRRRRTTREGISRHRQ